MSDKKQTAPTQGSSGLLAAYSDATRSKLVAYVDPNSDVPKSLDQLKRQFGHKVVLDETPTQDIKL